MALNIECEARTMLTEEQYQDIISRHLREKGNSVFIKQVNRYIDSEDFDLRNLNRKSLRIREINNGIIELTLKLKGSNGDKEYTEIISPLDVHEFEQKGIFPRGEIKDILLKDNVILSKLKILTSLSTLRYEEHFEDYLIVIDKNEYNGITDYNLEIEAPSMERAEEVMTFYCLKYNLTRTKNYQTKSKRAIQSIKK